MRTVSKHPCESDLAKPRSKNNWVDPGGFREDSGRFREVSGWIPGGVGFALPPTPTQAGMYTRNAFFRFPARFLRHFGIDLLSFSVICGKSKITKSCVLDVLIVSSLQKSTKKCRSIPTRAPEAARNPVLQHLQACSREPRGRHRDEAAGRVRAAHKYRRSTQILKRLSKTEEAHEYSRSPRRR